MEQKCVLAYTDGYELEQREYPDYDQAKRAMDEEYERCYDRDSDSGDESYLDDLSAKVVSDGNGIYLWSIHQSELTPAYAPLRSGSVSGSFPTS